MLQLKDNQENLLRHYGIKGMKWGIRRKRGSDGRIMRNVIESEDHRKVKQLRSKKTAELSNSELKDVVNRMQLEKQYKDLSKTDISAGRKFTQDIVRDVGRDLVKDALKTSAKGIMKKIK